MTEITENIAPYCFGYLTQYWFGILGPMPNKPTPQTVNSHLKIAFSKELNFGINAVILENGLVRFDLSNYEKGGIFIYRYEKLDSGESSALHAADLESREKSAQELAFRLIQVHAMLLDNARRKIEKCSSYSARPARISEILKNYDVADPIVELDPDFKYWVPLPNEVASKSLDDLAIAFSDEEGLFLLLDLYSSSLTHFLERRYSEALIAYWAAIEASINVLWDRLLNWERENSEIGLSKKRKERLTNAGTITASIKIEVLYLLRRISPDIYQKINIVREKRNRWMHKLEPIGEEATLEARDACERLLHHTFSFDIEGTIGGVGGAGGGLYKEVFCRLYPHKAGLFYQKSIS